MQIQALLMALFMGLTLALTPEQLLKQKSRSGSNTIKLTNTNFKNVISGPRASHLFVLLTATNANVGCLTCHEIDPVYTKIVDSWFSQYQDGANVFFAKADFIDGQKEIFQAFQVSNVPKLYYYSPTDKPISVLEGLQDVPILQDPAEFSRSLHQLISGISGKEFKVVEPIQWGSMIITISTVALLTFTLFRFGSFYVNLLTSTILWGFITVLLIIIFISGYMFNTVRGTPYVKPTQDGGIEYFIAGQQQQLGVETQVVSFIYMILTACTVALITKVKNISHPKVQIGVTSVLILIIFITFSAYLNIFAFKSSGYPYTLLDVITLK